MQPENESGGFEEPESQSTFSADADAFIPDSSERNWALFGHLSGLAGYVVPLGGIIGPLVIWLTQREPYPFAGAEALKALNFSITMVIAQLIGIVITVVTCGIGVVLLIALSVLHIVVCIIAAVTVSRGEPYVYPFTLDLVK